MNVATSLFAALKVYALMTAQHAVWTWHDFPWQVASPGDRQSIAVIRRRLFPQYREQLRVALTGVPERYHIAAFVSKSPNPPDFGAEGIVLNDCHSTPKCKYMCDGRYVDGQIALLGPSGYVCEDGALYFFKDIKANFPAGQHHVYLP